jgi:hypothetical protein
MYRPTSLSLQNSIPLSLQQNTFPNELRSFPSFESPCQQPGSMPLSLPPSAPANQLPTTPQQQATPRPDLMSPCSFTPPASLSEPTFVVKSYIRSRGDAPPEVRDYQYWGIVINKRSLNKVTLNKVSARQHERRLRRFCSTVAV